MLLLTTFAAACHSGAPESSASANCWSSIGMYSSDDAEPVIQVVMRRISFSSG